MYTNTRFASFAVISDISSLEADRRGERDYPNFLQMTLQLLNRNCHLSLLSKQTPVQSRLQFQGKTPSLMSMTLSHSKLPVATYGFIGIFNTVYLITEANG